MSQAPATHADFFGGELWSQPKLIGEWGGVRIKGRVTIGSCITEKSTLSFCTRASLSEVPPSIFASPCDCSEFSHKEAVRYSQRDLGRASDGIPQ